MLLSCYYFLISFVIWTGKSGDAQTRPNIVFILADDLGWNDVGFTGRSDLQTPNIDALAYNSRILTQHYASPTCTPSRAALLTGKYAIRTGMQGFPILAGEPRGVPLEHLLLPQHLKELGYSTHLVGKWHLGYHEWKFTPTARGFDSHFGYFNGYIDYFDHHISNFRLNQSGHDFWSNRTSRPDLKGQYVTDLLTEEAVRLIKAETARESPFFLLLSHLAPHAGNLDNKYQYLPEDLEKFNYIPSPNRRKFAAMIWRLDKSVGRVVRALADSLYLDNTIIVFASDNGAQSVSRWTNGGSNFPLRGTKLTVFEGGVRTVAFVWSSHFIKAQNTDLFHIADWMPTIYEAAGGSLRSLSGLDGVSQWRRLQGGEEAPARAELLINIDEKTSQRALRHRNWKVLSQTGYYFEGNTYSGYYGDFTIANMTYDLNMVINSEVNEALRSCDIKTKENVEIIVLRNITRITCQRDPNAMPCFPEETFCVFDLAVDPCESNNVASLRPDVLALLQAKLETYESMLTPQLTTDADPSSFPNLHNGTWCPWLHTSS